MKLFKRDHDLIEDTETGVIWARTRPAWWSNLLIALCGVAGSGTFYLLTYWWMPDWIRANLVRPFLSLF